jgi:hypothetical protein
VTPRTWLDLTGGWTWENYKRPSELDKEHRNRKDFIQSYGLTLTRQITEHVQLQGSLTWIDDDSNVRDDDDQNVFSYDRTVAGVAVRIEF